MQTNKQTNFESLTIDKTLKKKLKINKQFKNNKY